MLILCEMGRTGQPRVDLAAVSQHALVLCVRARAQARTYSEVVVLLDGLRPRGHLRSLSSLRMT